MADRDIRMHFILFKIREEISVEEFLKKDGKGRELMKRVDRVRKEREEERRDRKKGGRKRKRDVQDSKEIT